MRTSTVCASCSSLGECGGFNGGGCSLVKLGEPSNARREWFHRLTTQEKRRHMAFVGPLPTPVKLEVHPYRKGQEMPCTNDCGHCTRREDRYELRKGGIQGIDPDKLISLIKSFKGREVHGLVLSGNSTEPTCYPEIAQVIQTAKDVGLQVSLFSNFYFAEPISGLEVASRLAKDDVVRISLDAGRPETYGLVHQPRFRDAYEKIKSNIHALVQQRALVQQMRPPGGAFRVEISYVLMRANSARDELSSVVNWARDVGVDQVRFTLLLCPRIGNAGFDKSQVLSEHETAHVTAFLKHLEVESGDSACEIQVLEDKPEQPDKPFRKCHHWKFIAVLGACGRFFPCTSVSLVRLMDRLGRGNINSPQFDFWEFWADPHKWSDLRPQECAGGRPAECTHFEFAVNQTLDQLAAASPPC